jgi:RsiW-degrading membrane proteinase PrsW (M82 family)
MGATWYIQIGGAQQGPLSSQQLKQWALQGKLLPNTLVRKNEGQWVAAQRVRGLTFAAGAAAQTRAAGASWYCRIRGRMYGPLSDEQLRHIALVGTLRGDDFVRHGPNEAWMAAKGIRGLVFAAGIARPAAGVRHPVVEVARTQHRRAIALVACTMLPFLLPAFGPPLPAMGVWLLAAVAAAGGWFVLRYFYCPHPEQRGWAAGALLFTLVFGATTLLQFAEFATSLVDTEVPWHNAPLWLAKHIGLAYSSAAGGTAQGAGAGDFALSLLGAIFSVGICEELLKLLPVAVGIGSGRLARRQGAMFVGATAGLGFGLAESLWLSFDAYVPGQWPLSAYLTRFVGCAFAHAAISALGAALLFAMRPAPSKRPAAYAARWTLRTVAAAALVAVPHGLYDVCLSYGLGGLSGLTIAVIVFWLVGWKPRGGESSTVQVFT